MAVQRVSCKAESRDKAGVNFEVGGQTRAAVVCADVVTRDERT